jgi:hypothetical protein
MTDFTPIGEGEPVPAVSAADLSAVYSLMLRVQADFPANIETPGAPQQSSIGIDASLLADACGPGAHVFAIWLRSTLLEMMLRQGALAPWQRGDQLDASVFDVAATFPISRLDQFDGGAFLEQLRGRST